MPATLVVFPDAVALVINELRAQLVARSQTAPVQSDVPSTRPDRFVTVRKTGGQRRSIVTDGPRLTIAGWETSEEEASDLAELCRSIIYAMRGRTVAGVPVYGVTEVADPAPLQDISDQPRFVFSVELHVRGAAA